MEKYIGTKQVLATPMTRGEYDKYMGYEISIQDEPGYLVEYVNSTNPNHEDHEGYVSWSPKGVFDAAYKPNSTPAQRVKIELDELSIKLKGLSGFLNTNECKSAVGEAQFQLMIEQELAMEEYFVILSDRLAVFNEEPGELGGFSFGLAVNMAKKGCKVARKGWNGAGMFAYIVPANSYPAQTDAARVTFGDMVPYREYWALKTAQGDVSTWAPSGSDSLADDWVVVD